MHYGNKFYQYLYYHSPGFLRNSIATFYGFRQRRARYGNHYDDCLKHLQESQTKSNEQLVEYQKQKTKEFLIEICREIPYYNQREIYCDNVLGIGKLELNNLPVLSKQEIRDNINNFYHPKLINLPHTWSHTSGTTGSALIFPLSQYCFQREYAFRALHYSWGNVSLTGKDKIAFCSGHPVALPNRNKPPFWVYDYVNNHLFFSSYHLSEKNLKYYVRELDLFRPKMISGYPSSVYLLALAYKKYGTGKLIPSSIYTASETLFAYQRKTIEQVFQCKTFNWYGNSEMCANIVECEKGELHLKLEHSYVEILDANNEPVKPGESGRLVCTGFGNIAFPLVRYDIGDEVTLSLSQTSKCGRGGILIDKILGRVEDYIKTPDGTLVGRLDHLFKDAINVKEAQLVQESIDELILKIVPRDGYSKNDEESIRKEAILRLGNKINLNFEYVDSIQRTSNGKFKFVVSKIQN